MIKGMMVTKNWCRSAIRVLIYGGIVLSLSACGFVAQQIKEKNREEYLLNNPAVYNPRISRKPEYVTHRYRFLSRYRVSHDWPLDFSVCHYARIDLPKEQQDGTWYGSYNRLGSIFEYKENTLQERRSNGYPERSVDTRYLSKDKYFRSIKVLNKRKQEERGLRSICSQGFIRSNLLIGIRLLKKTKNQILADREQVKDRDFNPIKEVVKGNDWTVLRYKLRESNINHYLYPHEEWILPIADTGYSYSFHFLANTDSLHHEEYGKLKNIFRYLIGSLKIEKLNEKDAAKARDHVNLIIKGIEKYESNNRKR